MNIYRYIDVNCERTQDGLWQEPFNTLTGLAYFLVAYLLWQMLKKRPRRPFLLKFMLGITIAIGVGSMLFHSTARMWAALLDSVPIAIFAAVYMYALMRHILNLRWWGILLVMLVFIAANFAFKYFVIRAADGYISILPTLGFIALTTIYMWLSKNPSRKCFLLITLLSFIAVYWRIMDFEICKDFPIGTHFIWHLVMAGVIYNLNAELIRRHHSVQLLV